MCVCSGGSLLQGGVSAPGGVCLGVSAMGYLLRGVSAPGGGIAACTEADTPTCEQNDKQVQKYYLGHNFVAAGKKMIVYPQHRSICDRICIICDGNY